MTGNPPVTFRAGRGSSESPGHPAGLRVTLDDIAAPKAGPAVLLADISEFQASINDAKYLAWSKAVVIRGMYGAGHTDHAWFGGQRRALLLSGGARFLGIYQYLVAGQDAAAQARAFCKLVGHLNPGEVAIADIEEGGGSQRARWNAWAHVVSSELGGRPWNYSGLFFAGSTGIAPVDWVAAYQRTEPGTAHTLWQFTDAFAVPGVGHADCSIFHGTIDQLAALAHGGAKPPPPATPWTETLLSNLPALSAGVSGEDVKTVQGLLNARGYQLKIDGAYGPATRSAVTAFQHSRGLTADGTAGPATWHKLLGR